MAKRLPIYVVHRSVWHVRSVLALPANIDALFIRTWFLMNLMSKLILAIIQDYIKTFLINSKEENIKDGFWKEPENISKNFKYCRHCRIYENSSSNKSSFEKIAIRLKNESSFNSMLQHPTDIHFFNTVQESQVDKPAPCLQKPNKTHSNYLNSNLESSKSILTNKFLGIK